MNQHHEPAAGSDEAEDWDGLKFALTSGLRRPSVDEIAHRAAGRRREHTRRGVGLALTVVVIVAIPVAAALIGPHRPVTGATGAAAALSLSESTTTAATTPTAPATTRAPAAQPASAASASTDSSTTDTAPTAPDWAPLTIVDAQFSTPTRGVALLNRCTAHRCVTTVATTENGHDWSEHPTPFVPPQPGVDFSSDQRLISFGDGRILIGGWNTGAHDAWFSADSGRSWKPAPMTAGSPIAALADGSVLENQCVVVFFEPCAGGLVVRTPTGALSPVSTAPIDYTLALHQTGPQTWLLWGLDQPDSHQFVLYRSTNAGRSWTKIDTQTVSQGIFYLDVSGLGTAHLVATLVGQLPDAKNGLLSISVSDDAGRSWRTTWHAVDGQQPRSTLGVPVRSSSGTITVRTEADRCYRSRDDGRTFVPFTPCDESWWTTTSGDIYVRINGVSVQTSTDGMAWTTMKP